MLIWKAFDFSIKPEGVLLGILGCRFFPFITFNISCHSLLACRVSVEESVDSLMGVPWYVICHFSLVAFNNLPVFNLYVWLLCVLVCFSLGLSCLGLLCASWTWLTISFPTFGTFLAIISSNIFSGPFYVKIFLCIL